MIYQDDTQMMEEVRYAQERLSPFIDEMDTLVSSYVGRFFHGSSDLPMTDDLENHNYEYVSLVLPRLIFSNPRIAISTMMGEQAEQLALGLRLSGNEWIKKARVRDVLIRVAMDNLFGFGVILTTMQPAPGWESAYLNGDDVPMWPKLTRIPQRRYIRDPLAESWEEARYFGHFQIEDKEDLIARAKKTEDDGWLLDRIEAMPVDAGVEEIRGKSHARPRKEVVYAEVWIPEEIGEDHPGPSEGYYGTILTLAETGDDSVSIAIREPQPAYVPRWGPYVEFGTYPVPNDSMPLSPLMAVKAQVKELNDIVRANNTATRDYKRLILVDSGNRKLIKDLKDQPDLYIVPVEGLKKDEVITIEIAGLSKQGLVQQDDGRARLDRTSGLSDAQRGNPQKGIKATADAIAAEAGNIRIDFQKEQFTEPTVLVMRNAIWYMAVDEDFEIALGKEANEALGVAEGTVIFQGEGPEKVSPEMFEQMGITIEPWSMERTTGAVQQANTLMALGLAAKMVPLIAQFPAQSWKSLMDQLGDSVNVPELGKIAEEILAMVDQGLVPQQQQQGQPGGSGGASLGNMGGGLGPQVALGAT